ncbi:ATP-dependent helicase [Sediminibacterium goheungense]|uniref:DNA 3'-5' helicase n=1 Tax=Sediminibacterium goheungense TaxID=1086393 RepID=A0A4R6J274_9BACT|nr:UvrD-helicase domain-containing protein [Sediminibacterium goheungense]TDO29372.1 DNA helicase-2/ATP-dependent DNA helicase PcrA [Sediminibacterium goheungense]
MQEYLNGLNEPQREAVTHIKGPLMIVAGAGSGKTKVLTTRIAHLMNNGVDAFNILALTFTNKAAAEMKERIERILGNAEARNLYIGTFHSVFARILRAEAHRIGYPNSFTIYDTDDSRSVIKTVVNELNLDDKHYKPNVVGSRISSAKNALVGPAEYATDYYIQQEDMRANRPAIAQIYAAYANRCFKNGAMDFDDLLLKMYELLKNFPEVLHKYQHKFKYILIDEYQDTNPVQYQITKLLAAVHENICVVGDDAQSIYSFRGATIENILQFQKDYDDVKVVKLEQNYRSSQNIIHVANEVIKNNKGQIPKNLWTENKQGDKIVLVRTMTDNDEGRFVADCIQEQKLRYHFYNKDFAILYRTNAQSRSFEESLRRMGIAYRIYGGVSFYQRKEVKDFLAYLRVIANTRDEEALKRIINYPVRGIGKTTIEKCVIAANEQNISMYEVVSRAGEFGFKAGTLEALQNFHTMIRYFQSMLTNTNAYDVAIQVGKHTNLVKELFNDKTTEGLARYENIQELLNSIKEWTESPSNEDGELGDKSLGSYLQQITLLTDADDDKGEQDAVKMMTIHAAKGLEFECVFVGGVEETLFPSGMSINTREELEEERRLFYVAVTRAKQKLWLTYANARYRFGQLVQNDPSRFIEEMPEQYIDKTYAGGGARNNAGSDMGSAFERMQRGFGFGGSSNAAAAERKYGPPPSRKPSSKPEYLPVQPPAAKVVAHVPSADFVASDTSQLQAGQKVEHQKFGFGTVSSVEGSAHNPVATIQFEKNGEKKIMLNYAKLRIV